MPLVWGKHRRELRDLRRRFGRIEQTLSNLSHVIGHQAPPQPAIGIEVLAGMVGTMVESQAKQFEAQGNFLRTIAEIGSEKAAAAMGRRGGRANIQKGAKRGAGGRFAEKKATNCVLCSDPMASDFTVEEWSEHMKHKGGRQANLPIRMPSAPPAGDVDVAEFERGHTHADGTWHPGPDHDEQPTAQYPLPSVSIDHGSHAHGDGAAETGAAAVQPANGHAHG